MSVYGGDSWVPEAQYRKRRVDDLVVEGLDASSYRKLPSGKYACLVCPHNPVLDTSLMLSMHIKGSRHRVAETKFKEKEIAIQDAITKKQAISGCSFGSDKSSSTPSRKVNQPYSSKVRKPLIEQTRSATSEIFCSPTPRESKGEGTTNDLKSSTWQSTEGPPLNYQNNWPPMPVAYSTNFSAELQTDLRERRERELKFIEAGWKRDGHGKWHKDENAEFDSDEEDPNLCLT